MFYKCLTKQYITWTINITYYKIFSRHKYHGSLMKSLDVLIRMKFPNQGWVEILKNIIARRIDMKQKCSLYSL